MKLITTTAILTLVMLGNLLGQSITSETERKEISFKQPGTANVFYLANINGSIKVVGYKGEKVMLEAAKTVTAKSQERLDRSKNELSIGVVDRMDTIIVYIKQPCGFENQMRSSKTYRSNAWDYNWSDCDYDYDFKYDFILKVPEGMNLYLSTINKGNIEVSGVSGSLQVNNVNGGISLKQVSGLAKAHTINGDVTLEYSQLPKMASSYYTLNGDINALYPKGLKASMTFKSFNGDFYTNIQNIEYQQALIEKTKTNKGEGLAYKVDSRSAINVGGGGVALDFETFNGSVYVKEH